MQFLKALFWIIFGIVLALFAYANIGEVVTITLWGGLQADVKLPVLVLFVFLLGFLPTFLYHRARIWSLTRRLETQANTHVANQPVTVRPVSPAPSLPQDRQATDSKVWPAG